MNITKTRFYRRVMIFRQKDKKDKKDKDKEILISYKNCSRTTY